jgi:6-phosphogluconolactonase (cycloisomerase 2 family)/uncharacterized membrane protein
MKTKAEKASSSGKGRITSAIEMLLAMMAMIATGFGQVSPLGNEQIPYVFSSLDYPGGTLTTARGINDRGDIVGTYRIAPPRHALLIRKKQFIPLAPTTFLGTNLSDAFKINERGDVVGQYVGNDERTHGFLLSGGKVTTLNFPGASDTFAYGVNDRGVVVGQWDLLDANGNPLVVHGFVWKLGVFKQFDFPGAGDTYLFGINEHGYLVGGWDPGITSPIEHGFACSALTCVSLDVPFPGATATQFDDINNDNQMAGAYVDAGGLVHAFLKAGTKFTGFDFPGGTGTIAWGLNSRGQIVGRYAAADGSVHGFLAQPSGTSEEFAYSANLNQVTGFELVLPGGSLASPFNVSGPNDAGGMVADPTGHFLYVSDFTGNAIDAFQIQSATGKLTSISGSPFPVGSGNGPSGMAIDSAGKFLFLAHANLNGIFAFTRDKNTGALALVPGSPFAAGASTMHVLVDPSDRFLYASNYNDSMGAISAYQIDPITGGLTAIAGSPFPTQVGYPGPAQLAVEPSGKFLYVGLGGTVNANHFVAAFSIDPSTGSLTPVPGSPFTAGNGAFRVAVDRSGKYLYASNSFDNNISAFTIDGATGSLSGVSGSPFGSGASGGFPFALALDPKGEFLYTANQGSNNISAFLIDGTTGALTPVTDSPFAGITNPFDLIIVQVP